MLIAYSMHDSRHNNEAAGECQILAMKADTTPVSEYIEELSRIAFDLAKTGGRRSGWIMLNEPFLRLFAQTAVTNRIQIGVELANLMLDDDVANNAKTVCDHLAPDIEALSPDDPRVLQYWQCRCRCLVQLCAYEEAIAAFTHTKTLARTPEDMAAIEADIAEIHLLQGEIDRALQSLEQIGRL